MEVINGSVEPKLERGPYAPTAAAALTAALAALAAAPAADGEAAPAAPERVVILPAVAPVVRGHPHLLLLTHHLQVQHYVLWRHGQPAGRRVVTAAVVAAAAMVVPEGMGIVLVGRESRGKKTPSRARRRGGLGRRGPDGGG